MGIIHATRQTAPTQQAQILQADRSRCYSEASTLRSGAGVRASAAIFLIAKDRYWIHNLRTDLSKPSQDDVGQHRRGRSKRRPFRLLVTITRHSVGNSVREGRRISQGGLSREKGHTALTKLDTSMLPTATETGATTASCHRAFRVPYSAVRVTAVVRGVYLRVSLSSRRATFMRERTPREIVSSIVDAPDIPVCGLWSIARI